MPDGNWFIDSNIILYILASDRGKARISRDICERGNNVSVQVLNEVISVARRKMILNWDEVDELIQTIGRTSTIHPISLDTQRAARQIAQRFKISIYDAQIIASALEAGCDTLYSEDMQHGQVIENRLAICNPYI